MQNTIVTILCFPCGLLWANYWFPQTFLRGRNQFFQPAYLESMGKCQLLGIQRFVVIRVKIRHNSFQGLSYPFDMRDRQTTS